MAQLNTSGYRPEIDGLRALAVLPVMLFHAGVQTFSGGFVGVDVFFVISGYLITSIILNDINQGRFSIAGFYERRARRILPALFFVSMVCVPMAWLILYPRHFKEFSQSLIAVGTFTSNIFFWKHDEYFGTAAELKPLLHTWSLAVEEQFYILFPLALLACIRLSKVLLPWALLAGLLIGLAFAHWASYRMPSAAFFLLPTRGWELLVGALSAVYLLNSEPNVRAGIREALGAAGLLMISASVLLYDGRTPFPGAYALLPTLGTALVILFADRQTTAGRLLCAKPVVAIGLISYSAYLWHQPLLAFGRQLNERDPSPYLPLSIVGLSLVLAYFSWKFVEVPWRKTHKPADRGRTLVLASVLLLTLVAAGTILSRTGVQEKWSLRVRLGYPEQKIARHYEFMSQLQYKFDEQRLDNGECVFWSESLGRVKDRIKSCAQKFGSGVLYIGDSHMKNFHNVAYHAGHNAGFRVTLAKGACRFNNRPCLYDELETFLKESPQLFSTLVYHQSGSHLLLDKAGRSDTQLSFTHPESTRIDLEEIELITAGLNRLAKLVPKVYFLGPFYEPRVSFDAFEHLANDYTPPASTEELFVRLDNFLTSEYSEGASVVGFRYVSLLSLQPKSLRTLVSGECFVFQDLDHFSLCGEKLFGESLKRLGGDLLPRLGIVQ